MKLITILSFSALALALAAMSAQAKPLIPLAEDEVFTGIAAPESDAEFEGIAKIAGCSASLVKFVGQSDQDHAMILTNDHCLDDQAYGTFTVGRPYAKGVAIYDSKKQPLPKTFQAQRLIYATQTDTDFGLLELPETYAEIKQLYNVRPLELAPKAANIGDDINVITGYFGKVIECQVDGFVHKLVESTWTWTNSYRYSRCDTGHGTSGSPLVLKGTRTVVGINNTGNDDGERCTLNNPCEVDAAGQITVDQGRNYGQQTAELYTCLNSKKQFDLRTPGCKLLGGDAWVQSVH